jgi:hypothetical protein
MRRLGCLLVLLAFVWGGCTSGPMNVSETYYYRVSNGTNANYFKLSVDAASRLGVSEYRSGYFPARSVDSLFGEVTSQGGIDALRMRDEVEKMINTNVFLMTQQWLEVARQTNASPEALQSLADARRRLLTIPLPRPTADVVVMDYNPLAGIIEQHADEKLVFLLSSNPDEVIGKIANFSESDQTVLTIQRLSESTLKRRSDETSGRQAELTAQRISFDAVVYRELQAGLRTATNSATTATEAIQEIDRMLNLLDSQP